MFHEIDLEDGPFMFLAFFFDVLLGKRKTEQSSEIL